MIKYFLLVCITLASQTAYAGELELALTATQGLSRTKAYLVGLEHSIGHVSASARYRYGTTDDETTTDQGYLNLAYDHDLSSRWSVWVFDRSGFNNVRGIDQENFLGFGPKYYLIKNSTTRLSMSVGYLHQLTDHSGAGVDSISRMSYRPKLSVSSGGTEIRVVFFYQPAIGDADDYITIAEASYRMAIGDTLALKATVEDEYRSRAEGARHEIIQYISLLIILGG